LDNATQVLPDEVNFIQRGEGQNHFNALPKNIQMTERWRTEKFLPRVAGLRLVIVNFSGLISKAIFLSFIFLS
jgi:hypothetical protein